MIHDSGGATGNNEIMMQHTPALCFQEYNELFMDLQLTVQQPNVVPGAEKATIQQTTNSCNNIVVMSQQQQQQSMERNMCHIVYDYNADYTNLTSKSNDHAAHNTTAVEATANKSDTSTVGDVSDDIMLTEPDDGLAYLTQMKSDDLMKFSQQSAIDIIQRDHLYSEDISEVCTVEPKQTLNVLPTFEEHDIGGYKFQVNLPTKRQRKSNWIFSEKLNKIYIRMNESFNLDATFTPKTPQTPLRLRMLLCFVKEVGEPVLRCQNHISKDIESDQEKRVSLLRCENPDAEYCGTENGRSILDRYSVVVPLNMSTLPGADNTVKQTIALKFACQNSCIGRRETSLIFLLESMNSGEILSQRVLDVKICSCPKRDRNIDERNNQATAKRKMFEDSYPGDRKVPRQCSSSPSQLKDELSCSDLEEDSNDGSSKPRCELSTTASGGCRLIVDLDNVQTAVRMLEVACESLAKTVLLYRNNDSAKREFKRLHRLHQKFHKS